MCSGKCCKSHRCLGTNVPELSTVPAFICHKSQEPLQHDRSSDARPTNLRLRDTFSLLLTNTDGAVYHKHISYYIVDHRSRSLRQVVFGPSQGRGGRVSEESQVSSGPADTPVHSGKEEEKSKSCFFVCVGWPTVAELLFKCPAGCDFD